MCRAFCCVALGSHKRRGERGEERLYNAHLHVEFGDVHRPDSLCDLDIVPPVQDMKTQQEPHTVAPGLTLALEASKF